jgi:hypothetical protein
LGMHVKHVGDLFCRQQFIVEVRMIYSIWRWRRHLIYLSFGNENAGATGVALRRRH